MNIINNIYIHAISYFIVMRIYILLPLPLICQLYNIKYAVTTCRKKNKGYCSEYYRCQEWQRSGCIFLPQIIYKHHIGHRENSLKFTCTPDNK